MRRLIVTAITTLDGYAVAEGGNVSARGSACGTECTQSIEPRATCA